MFNSEFFLAKLYLFFTNSKTQIIISTCAVICIFAAEIFILGYKKSSIANITRGDVSSRKDLLSYILDLTGLLRIIGHALTLGIGYLIGQLINKYLNLDVTKSFTNPIFQIVFFLVAKSFFDYWMHRFMHQSPALWEIHKYHHSATEMNVVTAHRESVLVAPWSSLYFAVPLGILGSPVTTLLLVGFFIEIHALLIHSQFKFSFGKFGEYFLISPKAHLIHHSLALEHRDVNFGFLFSFWDHIFGTYKINSSNEPVRIGVEDEIYNNASWLKEQTHGVRSFVMHLFKPERKAAKRAV